MADEKTETIEKIRQRMYKVTPLPDEPEFAYKDETIVRFLKAHEWREQDAENGLLETVEYRRQNRPLRTNCRWCHSKPGYHSMRQVGNDESGRPVVYANFAQATATKNSLEDIVHHVTYLIENAKVTMQAGVSTWVFVIDCTGMTLSVCSPKVGLKLVNLLSAHYPERLGLIICVNHNPIFHAFWKAIKSFMSPSTVSKMKLLRSEAKIRQAFSSYFPDDLASWLWDEISINKTKPMIPSQRQFWAAAPPEEHDPRGCPSYRRKCIDTYCPSFLEYVPGKKKMHCPHPNIAVLPGSPLETVLFSEKKHLLEGSSDKLNEAGGLIDEADDICVSDLDADNVISDESSPDEED